MFICICIMFICICIMFICICICICTYMIILLWLMYGHHFWRSSPGRGGPDGGHGYAAEGEGGLREKFPGAEGHHRPGAQGLRGAAALLKEYEFYASLI